MASVSIKHISIVFRFFSGLILPIPTLGTGFQLFALRSRPTDSHWPSARRSPACPSTNERGSLIFSSFEVSGIFWSLGRMFSTWTACRSKSQSAMMHDSDENRLWSPESEGSWRRRRGWIRSRLRCERSGNGVGFLWGRGVRGYGIVIGWGVAWMIRFVGMKSTVYIWQIKFVHESKNLGSELHAWWMG
jgi:hypothetical protein